MPRVNTTKYHKLFCLYHFYDRQSAFPAFTWDNLLHAGRNLAFILSSLHSRGYVIGDVNESNFLVSEQALVTIVDCDSMQVRGPGRTFLCEVGKDEYIAPELYYDRSAVRRADQDNFSLAILLFLMLMEGFSPFDGIGDESPPEELILNGNTPYVLPSKVTPKPNAPPFAMLPAALQALFVRAFGEGHKNPAVRPTSEEFYRALAAVKVTRCKVERRHVYPEHNTKCPWCERATLLGIDTFAAAEPEPVPAAQPVPKQVAQPVHPNIPPVTQPQAQPQSPPQPPPPPPGILPGTFVGGPGTTPVRRIGRGWAIALGWVAGFLFLEVIGPFIVEIMFELRPRTPNGFGWLGLLWNAVCSVLFGILITSLLRGKRAQASAATGLAVLLTAMTMVILTAVGAGSNASRTTGPLVENNGVSGSVVGSASGNGSGSSENGRVVPVLSGDISDEISTAINNWRDAILSNDPSRLADCYAGTLDRYFLQTNVTHDYVKQYIMNMHDRGDFVRSEQISQISLQRLSDVVVEAQFIETFDSVSASQDKQATVRTILHFTKESGGWKISYERQLNSAPGDSPTDNATIQNTTSASYNPTESTAKTTDSSAIAPSPATHSDQMPAESGTSNTQSLESGPVAAAPVAPVRSTSRVPYGALPPIPPEIMIRTDADRRGTLTLFPDHIEYRDEGMGTNGGPAPYGPNPDNNFTLSCTEILGIKAYGFRPVLFGSYQVVITARSGKYHIPTLHSQPIVQGIQNRCVKTGPVTALGVATSMGGGSSGNLEAPVLLSPADGAQFHNFPRRTTLSWEAVPGAASYTVEVDFSNPPGWGRVVLQEGIVETHFSFDFVGMQRGRWRVCAIGANSHQSECAVWREFEYTV